MTRDEAIKRSGDKEDIIRQIKRKLNYLDGRIIIVGSFLSDSWSNDFSDIDLVITSHLFALTPYHIQKKEVLTTLGGLDYKFDVFLYTPSEFEAKIHKENRFCDIIEGGYEI